MLEAFTLAGAIVAFANAVFTVWDRWVRGRPLAWLTVTVRTGGTPHDPCMRITNPGPADLWIQSVRVHPEIYGVAKAHGIKATMAAVGDVTVEGADVLNVILRSGERHDLPIVDRRRNAEDVQGDALQRVHFFIYWRKTSSSWLWQPPVWCMTSTRDIQRIRAATVP
jgi:hypothetical protein